MGSIWSRGQRRKRQAVDLAALCSPASSNPCLLDFLFVNLSFWKPVYVGHTVLRLYFSFHNKLSLLCK